MTPTRALKNSRRMPRVGVETLEQASREIELLRGESQTKALKFYADEKNYFAVGRVTDRPLVVSDGGKIARDALEKK
jgi:hypothetical protein